MGKHIGSLSDCGTLLDERSTTTMTLARKRWRFACIAIYSSRALLSLIKEKIDNTTINLHHQQRLYTVLEIESSCTLPTSSSSSTIDQSWLSQIVKEKSLDSLGTVGGVHGLAKAIKTDVENGINGDTNDMNWRREHFGCNTYSRPPSKGFFYFVQNALKDHVLIILIICATLSLGFGIKVDGPKQGWYEGGSIFIAVFLVVFVTAVSDFKQQKQFTQLSKISDNIITLDVIRNGRRQQVSIFDIMVGDIVLLKIGDQVPADGLFIKEGYNHNNVLQIDESSLTGESEHVEINSMTNPFLHSGSKVVDGHGRMMVTSVGKNTSWGEMMTSLISDQDSIDQQTPLQVRLNALTSTIGKVGLCVAFLVLVVLLVRYLTGNTHDQLGRREFKGGKTGASSIMNSVVRIISDAVTIVVVAIPEGLPLAVTLTLAYSMKRMMADHALVRKLSACETMGSATVICTDKTGTLTMNQMQVTKCWIGDEEGGFAVASIASPNVVLLLQQGVSLNTTASVYIRSGIEPEILGSPTEKAILYWAINGLGMDDMERIKQMYSIIEVESFNSDKKRSGVMVRNICNEGSNIIDVHWKGAAEMILAMCSDYYTISGAKKSLDEYDGSRRRIKLIIEGMAANSLRCIAFAHIQQVSDVENTHRLKMKEEGLTLLGIIGIEDPCRPEVKNAVEICKKAGVKIKMITGDNMFTAKAIATECGILDLDGEVVEGSEFRNYTLEERMQKVEKISVMARSSPLDKLLMVESLKQKGHVVAVTGDGTNDAPALKEADIGLSMGIQGTQVAKDASDIVILDDNFKTVATVLRWGRCVHNNIQKFIQFQLTVNVAALVINFIAAISAGEVPLTAVQLLWVNLIMDTLGALALATELPTNDLLDKPPVGRSEPLITCIMWRNLFFQALYQIIVLLILQFKGKELFGVDTQVKNTIIFNTFVLCQIFNEFNSRRLEKKNIFQGIDKNPLFIGIVAITIILQVMMVEVLTKFADTKRLNLQQWLACIIIATLSWPIGYIVKFINVP